MNDDVKQHGRVKVAVQPALVTAPIVFVSTALAATIFVVLSWVLITDRSSSWYSPEDYSVTAEPVVGSFDVMTDPATPAKGNSGSDVSVSTQQHTTMSQTADGDATTESEASVRVNGKSVKLKDNESVQKTITTDGGKTTVKINVNSNSEASNESYLDVNIESNSESLKGGD